MNEIVKNEEIISIYNKDIPQFILEGEECPAFKRILKIGMHCGMEYTSFPFYKDFGPYSRGFHSLGVALIIYHFTNSVKESLSGLYHDIATPAFSHVIDFLNKDYLTQESTEEKTSLIITNDNSIQCLLKRLGLTTSDVSNYHMYPIADNDSPKLSADRLEYTLSNFLNYSFATIQEVKDIYDDLVVSENEFCEPELCFKHVDMASKFALLTLKNSRVYVNDCDRYGMEILARLIKKAIELKVLTMDDLYLTEDIVISKLESNPITKHDFDTFSSMNDLIVSTTMVPNAIKVKSKKRYINPFVIDKGRISKIDSYVKQEIDSFLSLSFDEYLSDKNVKAYSFKV